ncbi:hypothetical protein J28TS4_53490 [Paenibacillus lautus]|uniref:hypothetical protein n=1 Tax=Paenibacillus lautus TaxID=1401 RepID=UPI001B1F7745|nr:hypothetical protein [Paenibacillus lautus]GIP06942.1 hypothetical protein J28TS4_53490 [Paenibacillus lautus]
MIDSHNLVDTAQALVDFTKQYLIEIQSNEDWSSKSDEFISIQSKLVKDFQNADFNSLPVQEKKQVQELFRVCYQLESQINHEIARQHGIVSNQISQLRKGNNFKSKYEVSSLGSGIMFDTYK